MLLTDLRELRLEPGESRRLWWGVGAAWLGPVPLPLYVARGREPGAKLVALGAQHGAEGSGGRGLLELRDRVGPGRLRGELWLLPCLNVYAFTAGHRDSPFDGQNLNRVHPGRAEGTLAEQVAHALRRSVLPGTDLL